MFEKTLKRLEEHTSGLKKISVKELEKSDEISKDLTVTEQTQIQIPTNRFSRDESLLETLEREQELQKRRSVRDLSILWEG